MPNVPTTGPELRTLRELAGLSLFDVAQRLGLHESALSTMERERREMPEGLPKLYRRAVVEISRDRARAAAESCRKGRVPA